MSVTPSPIGGFAAQFFDNNGVILSGGKIYTYAAGTTTPQASYTSATGVTAHANPIILDSAGRVPGGEIWLTDGLIYKFVIETATSILLGTYDNITGVNSNFVNYTVQEEVITATAGQTVFNLSTINYTPGTNSLSVYIDGVNQYVGDSYLETDSDTVTFTSGVHVGGEVKFTTAIQTTTGAIDSSAVAFIQSGSGAVARTAQAKMREIVSVKDFGATGDGITSDGAAIVASITAIVAQGGGTITLPPGTFNVGTWSLALSNTPVIIRGASCGGTTLTGNITITGTSSAIGEPNLRLENIGFTSSSGTALILKTIARFICTKVWAYAPGGIGIDIQGSLTARFVKCRTNNCATGVKARKSGIYPPNLLTFVDHEARANTSWAFDVDQGESFTLRGGDISANGTAGNTATGAIKLGANMCADPQVGWSSIEGCYVEANYGTAISIGASIYLSLRIANVNIIGTELIGGVRNSITVGSVRQLEMDNVQMGSSTDTTVLGASITLIKNSSCPVLTDNSTDYLHINVRTSTEIDRNARKISSASYERQILSVGELWSGRASNISGMGGANDYDAFYQSTAGTSIVNIARGAVRLGPNTLGFYGTTPIAKQTGTAANATDLATAITLVNDLKTKLIALGIIA
jgi:hypothetical protein